MSHQCPGHDWIENADFVEDPGEVDGLEPENRNLLLECKWICKHCGALAETCYHCDGNGDMEHELDLDDLDEEDPEDLECPVCQGDEVIVVREGRRLPRAD